MMTLVTARQFLLKALLLASLSLGFSVQAQAKANEHSLDNIVAIVNDNVITQTELNQSVHLAESQLVAENVPTPAPKTLRKQILQHLINNKIQMELAEQSGIQVNDLELDKVIAHLAKDNGLSTQEFYKRIAEQGLTEKAYRKQIRETLMLQRLQQREVASRINVTPDEINDFLSSSSQQVSGENEYHIQDILVALSDSPSPQEIAIAKKFSEDIIVRLRKGTALNNLAPAEAEALQTNDLGWRKLAEVPTAFAEAVIHMKAREFTGPVQTSNGFHIIHLVGLHHLTPHAKKTPRQEVAQLIFQRKFEEALQGWLAKMRGQTFIVIQDTAQA